MTDNAVALAFVAGVILASACAALAAWLGDRHGRRKAPSKKRQDKLFVIALKGEDKYIWGFREDEAKAIAENVVRQAREPGLSLSMPDAWWIVGEIKQQLAGGEPLAEVEDVLDWHDNAKGAKR